MLKLPEMAAQTSWPVWLPNEPPFPNPTSVLSTMYRTGATRGVTGRSTTELSITELSITEAIEWLQAAS
jgi:hypothetical protein